MAMVGWVSFSWMAILSGRFSRVPVLVQVVAQDIATEASAEEVLLAQAKDLALGVVIVGVQDLGDQLCGSQTG